MELEQIITLMDAMAKNGITGFSWEDEKNGVRVSIKRKQEAFPKGAGSRNPGENAADIQLQQDAAAHPPKLETAEHQERNIRKEASHREEPRETPSGRIRVPANYSGTVHWEEGIQEGITLSKDKIMGHMILPNGVRINLVAGENGVLGHLLVKGGGEVEKGETLYELSR